MIQRTNLEETTFPVLLKRGAFEEFEITKDIF